MLPTMSTGYAPPSGSHLIYFDASPTDHGPVPAGYSGPGSTAARSGFQRALTRVEARGTGGIVVAKVNRLAASLAAAIAAIRRFADAGGRLISVEENVDTGAPKDGFALALTIGHVFRRRAAGASFKGRLLADPDTRVCFGLFLTSVQQRLREMCPDYSQAVAIDSTPIHGAGGNRFGAMPRLVSSWYVRVSRVERSSDAG
jgi:hypothetical protein